MSVSQSALGDFEDGDIWQRGPVEPVCDWLFPSVAIEAGFLVWPDVLALEFSVWPLLGSCVVGCDGFGEELVAVGCDPFDVEGSGFDGPESAASGFVLEVDFFVSGSDEQVLPGLGDVAAAVWRAVAFGGLGDELFEVG